MNSPNCEQTKSMLLDYIEGEMPLEESNRVAEHLAKCDVCNTEFNGLRAMLNKAKNLSYDDPGEEFWRQLPIKVLQQVRQEQSRRTNNIVDFNARQDLASRKSSNKLPPRAGSFHAEKKMHRLSAALGIAATLLLVINIIAFSPKAGVLWFDQARFLANIETDKSLSQLAQSVAVVGESARMGFIEQQRNDRAFYIGSLLAESVVYLQSSDQQRALERLQYLHQGLQNSRVSAVTLSSIRKAIESLQAKRRKSVSANKLMMTFQGDFENYLSRTAPQQLALFRAGIWLFNAELAVAAKDAEAVKRLNRTQQIQYLQNVFSRMNAPIGIEKSLGEIAVILSQSALTDRDFRALKRSVGNLRTLMG